MPKKAKGFKNTTTLDAITARYARTCSLSVDCTAMPPEAEPIEDTQTPGLITKPPEHPLQNSWCVKVRVVWGELPISARRYRATFPFTYGILCYSSLYTQGRYVTIQRLRCRTHHRHLRIARTRLWHLRSGLDDCRRLRYSRVILPVLQLAQAPVQARTQFKLSFVQVGYQADVGG
jgi:hypothetical protein